MTPISLRTTSNLPARVIKQRLQRYLKAPYAPEEPKSRSVSIRLSKSERELLEQLAAMYRTTKSHLINAVIDDE